MKVSTPDRFAWQKDTLKKLRAIAGAYTGNALETSQFVDYQYAIVFGYAQSGKTELILKLIGVLPQYHTEVYELLRADQKYGQSSTATAIMYHQSQNNKFGIKSEPLMATEFQEVQWCDAQQLKEKLKQLRDSIEQTRAAENKVLHIYIPKDYFAQSTSQTTDILDFPGIESRNAAEADYVNMLAQIFLPLASVIVIVCLATRLTSLQQMKVPGMHDILWSEDAERFLLVPTAAFTTQTGICARAYKKDPDTFMQVAQESCREQARPYLKNADKIKIYPIELGNSLEHLDAQNDWKTFSPDFYNKMIEENEKTILELRHEIQVRRNIQPLGKQMSLMRSVQSIHNHCTRKLSKKQKESEKRRAKLCTQVNNAKERCEEAEDLLRTNQNTWHLAQKTYKKNLNKAQKCAEDETLHLKDTYNDFVDFKSKQDEIHTQLCEGLKKITLCFTEQNGKIDKFNFKPKQRDFQFLDESNADIIINQATAPIFLFFYPSKSEVQQKLESNLLPLVNTWHKQLQDEYAAAFEAWTEENKQRFCVQPETEQQISTQHYKMLQQKSKEINQEIQQLQREINRERKSYENATKNLSKWTEIAREKFIRQKNELLAALQKTPSEVEKTKLFLVYCLISADFNDIVQGER